MSNCGHILTPEKIAEIKKKDEKVKKGCGIGCLSVIVIFVILAVIGSFSSKNTTPNTTTNTAPKSKEETRKDHIQNSFSSWDGSHRGLTEYIKKSMNDPSSYKHENTVYWDKGEYLLVKTTFRGKNAFGALVKNSVMAKVDLNGSVTEILASGQ